MFRPKTVDAAIAPFARIEDNLRHIVERQNALAGDLETEIMRLHGTANEARGERDKAEKLADKIAAVFTDPEMDPQ